MGRHPHGHPSHPRPRVKSNERPEGLLSRYSQNNPPTQAGIVASMIESKTPEIQPARWWRTAEFTVAVYLCFVAGSPPHMHRPCIMRTRPNLSKRLSINGLGTSLPRKKIVHPHASPLPNIEPVCLPNGCLPPLDRLGPFRYLVNCHLSFVTCCGNLSRDDYASRTESTIFRWLGKGFFRKARGREVSPKEGHTPEVGQVEKIGQKIRQMRDSRAGISL
jgi:hypothetical protein